MCTADKSFMDLFYPEIEDLEIDDCSTNLNLHILKIENNKFAYHELVDNLFENVITYCLSRTQLDEYRKSLSKPLLEAVRTLKDYNQNEGEMGELLLYCFLECHLGAPKVFTKMELKTNSEDYVKGSDGVHILKLDEHNYQLIFGESKLRGDFKTCISDAFKSIHLFIHRKKNNLNSEIKLLNTHLKAEAKTNEDYEFLKSIIIPSGKDDKEYKDNTFGIFAGFNLEVNEDLKNLSNSEFRSKIRAEIKGQVIGKMDLIKKKVSDYQLQGYTFYVYACPFINLEDTRKRVIKSLIEKENDFQ